MEAVITLEHLSHQSFLSTFKLNIFNVMLEMFLICSSSSLLLQQLFNCQFLNRLSMPDNDVTVLPAAIANLVNLRELDVSKNSKQKK